MHPSRFQDCERHGTSKTPLLRGTAESLMASLAAGWMKTDDDTTEESVAIEPRDGDLRVVWNGTQGELYYEIRSLSIADQLPLYAARRISGRWFVVHGSHEGPHVDDVGILTHGNGVPVYTAKHDGRWYVLHAHNPVTTWYDRIHVLSCRDGLIHFIASRGELYWYVRVPLAEPARP